MSSSDLYIKGMNSTDCEDENKEDIWDDRKLNDAYDKALKMANLEVAKRVAMATNTDKRKKEKSKGSSEPQIKQSEEAKPQKKTKQNKEPKMAVKDKPQRVWKKNMLCRARYIVDDCEYEAMIIAIIDNEHCVVKYIGYDNTEVKSMCDLQPSLGELEQKKQLLIATLVNVDNQLYEIPEAPMPMSGTMRGPSMFQNNQRGRSNRPQQNRLFQVPNDHGMSIPVPPPPTFDRKAMDACKDDSSLSNMLYSWYLSGYYTGLYHGKNGNPRQRHC